MTNTHERGTAKCDKCGTTMTCDPTVAGCSHASCGGIFIATHDTPCQGGCGKVRSILHADDPADWLCNECRTKHARVHFIAMSGTHGCLPDSCNAYPTYRDAMDALVDMFGLGRTRKARLFADRYLKLGPQDGAEYCEVAVCHCDKPWEHCDAGPDPRDWPDYPKHDAE